MTAQKLDRNTKRVLNALADAEKHTRGPALLNEVTERYNRMYPPTLIQKLMGKAGVGATEVGIALKRLADEGFVSISVTSYTYKPLRVPKKQYSTTQKTTQYFGAKGGKRNK